MNSLTIWILIIKILIKSIINSKFKNLESIYKIQINQWRLHQSRRENSGLKMSRPRWKSARARILALTRPFSLRRGYLLRSPSQAWSIETARILKAGKICMEHQQLIAVLCSLRTMSKLFKRTQRKIWLPGPTTHTSRVPATTKSVSALAKLAPG